MSLDQKSCLVLMARIYVLLKFGVRDNEGIAVSKTLIQLGYDCVDDMRMGKYMEIDLNCDTIEEASDQIEKMCAEMLVNNIIQRYTYDIEVIHPVESVT